MFNTFGAVFEMKILHLLTCSIFMFFCVDAENEVQIECMNGSSTYIIHHSVKKRCEKNEVCDENGMQLITVPEEKCCDGFEFVDKVCKPICDPQCTFGVCEKPGKCKCIKGYSNSKTLTYACEPICKPGCDNATCKAPDECECFQGYVIDQYKRHICNPHCSNGCANGECIEPEKCACDKGYVSSKNNNVTSCLPYCALECINGGCTRPNHCECNNGYNKSRIRWNVCEPYCFSCDNGKCISPGNCSCSEGYVLDGSSMKCVPRCSNGCINGNCIGPEACTCKNGFKMGKNSNICEPICPGDCKYGRCISPGLCLCYKGYVYNETDCIPSCKSDCIHGLCKAPNVCSCEKGTLKSGPFHCTLICTTNAPNDETCYHNSTFSIPSLEYSLNESKTFLELTKNGSVSQIPCAHRPTIITNSTVIDYTCFTHLRVEEGSVAIVCSIANDTTEDQFNDETEWTIYVKPSQIQKVDLVLLNRNATSKLCAAHICPNSNRAFYIDRKSKLSMCVDWVKVDDGEKGEVQISSIALYSIIAIVVASTIVVIKAKCIARKNKYYTFGRSNPNRDSQIPFIEEEPEGGEIGHQAFEYSDISDRLEDLK